MSTIDIDKKVAFIELGAAGTGSIQANENQQQRLEEFTNRVGSGEFHVTTTGSIPCKCIDGRCGSTTALMPNSAGGSETLMVADDLTTKDFADTSNATTCDQFKNTLTFLSSSYYPVGGHTAAELYGAPSGCGANDKLPAIYEYISQNGDTVRSIAESLGYTISDNDHSFIIDNATKRSTFSDGRMMLNALENQGGKECIDILQKGHTEVLAIINRRTGTTLDRDAVQAEFGDDYEAFNVDEWAFEEGARVISKVGGSAAQKQKRIAMMYYNLATAGVLCGPKMRVVVLD